MSWHDGLRRYVSKVLLPHTGYRPYGLRIWLYIILLAVVSSQNLFCSKKTLPFEPTTPLGIDNKWIYDSLTFYYYWSDEIKGSPDYSLPTETFLSNYCRPKTGFPG
ncbi:hypothetical protein [Paraflavitalea speifideaquila]|uniref:hypothetical protein n=1 Tax=Paraflavitalea speifideaquila TaxID=3076558 RepID=UPI0028EC0CDA|nr:hypothetical protein [Paraflavitalea speifideiaquila]